MTQERVQKSRGKRAIGIRAIKVSTYFVLSCLLVASAETCPVNVKHATAQMRVEFCLFDKIQYAHVYWHIVTCSYVLGNRMLRL